MDHCDKGPVQQFPLAVCAADSLKYPEDFVVFEIQYKDRIGENWFIRDSVDSKDNHHQKWFYYPRMKKNEALIFKQVWFEYLFINMIINIIVGFVSLSSHFFPNSQSQIPSFYLYLNQSDICIDKKKSDWFS